MNIEFLVGKDKLAFEVEFYTLKLLKAQIEVERGIILRDVNELRRLSFKNTDIGSIYTDFFEGKPFHVNDDKLSKKINNKDNWDILMENLPSIQKYVIDGIIKIAPDFKEGDFMVIDTNHFNYVHTELEPKKQHYMAYGKNNSDKVNLKINSKTLNDKVKYFYGKTIEELAVNY